MLETNFAGASCAAQPARIETRSPSNSTAPKNLLVFRRGASAGRTRRIAGDQQRPAKSVGFPDRPARHCSWRECSTSRSWHRLLHRDLGRTHRADRKDHGCRDRCGPCREGRAAVVPCIGFSATDSACALKVAGISFAAFFHHPGIRHQLAALRAKPNYVNGVRGRDIVLGCRFCGVPKS